MTKAQGNVIDVQVGRQVRMVRRIRQRSRASVANDLGISERDYFNLEEGRCRFAAVQLVHLSRLFHVNAAVFLGGPDKREFSADTEPKTGRGELCLRDCPYGIDSSSYRR